MHTYRRIGTLLLLLMGFATAVAIPLTQANDTNDTFVYLPLITKPVQPPIIETFTANVPIADPGDTIELSWQTQNAVTVTLYHLLPTGQFGTFWDVAPAGTMTYTIPSSTRNYERFALFADNNDFPYDSASLEIELTCPFTWFFAPAPDICPQDAALISPGAEQPFEHGTMLWVGEEDRIYILFDDDVFSPKWMAYEDRWDEGDPVDDPTIVPPPGFYQPQRGFGLVWREQPTIRDRLGWAIAPETGYETAVQRTSYPKYNETYIRALDDNVWQLKAEHSGWEKIIVND